jgi:hypothetical protein
MGAVLKHDLLVCCKLWGVGFEAGGRDDLLRVDDQRDTPVPKDRRRGDSGDHPVVFLEALDDDLTLVVDDIDGERRPASGLTFDEKENIAVA